MELPRRGGSRRRRPPASAAPRRRGRPRRGACRGREGVAHAYAGAGGGGRDRGMSDFLPAWLEPLPDAGEQRALDEWAIGELGIPGLELMERAGTGLADLVVELVPAGRVVVVCGKGNNGGDGLVVARRLRERGRDADVLLLGAPDELRGDARTNCERLPGPGPQPFTPASLDGAAGIVDAILGTGFSGEPRDPAAGAIEAINEA